MRRIATIVEGYGEVEAVPILLRRIARHAVPELAPAILRPIRVDRHRIIRAGELERTVELAARQAGAGGGILILLDADDDCPGQRGTELLSWARAARTDFADRIRVVLAKAEYQAWFLAAAASLAGKHGIDPAARHPPIRKRSGMRKVG